MPKYLILLLLCFCCISAFTQHKKPKSPLKHRVFFPLKSPHDDCISINKYTVAQRLKHYPFNKSAKIIAVSYHNVGGGPPNEEVLIDTATGKIIPSVKFDTLKYGLRVKNGELNPASIVETVVLNKNQINTLTNLIYNTDFRVKGNNGIDPGHMCFAPRNALLFVDQLGKIFDYLQICFACENYESKSGRINLGTGCYQKIKLAKKWFIDTGFQFGTIKKDGDE